MPLKKQGFRLKKSHWIGIISAILLVVVAIILRFLVQIKGFDNNALYFVIGFSFVIASLPFFTSLIFESRRAEEKEEMFLEFTRDLVEGVRSGTSISKSILNVRTKNYESLNPHIDKLANQITLGIPVKFALETFANEVDNKVISRAVTLISEAELAGGRIETILESVAASVGQIEKLRKERMAAIYNLTVQGYVIFLIFILIMLVMQYKILPITSEIGGAGASVAQAGAGSGFSTTIGGINLEGGANIKLEDMANAFLYLLIIQGFFAGLVIGKISEGSAKSGLRHSFILVSLAILIALGARVFLG